MRRCSPRNRVRGEEINKGFNQLRGTSSRAYGKLSISSLDLFLPLCENIRSQRIRSVGRTTTRSRTEMGDHFVDESRVSCAFANEF